EGQPNISRGFGCAGFVELNSKTGEAVPSEQYRMFRHVSPFVRRGAQVLIAPVKSNAAGSERVTSLLYSTFKNPDGSYVVVLACPKTGKEPSWCPNIQFQIKLNNQYLPLQMLAGSITTVVIRGS
ncbi:MAG: glycoside hydrolase family 30 protein, partial [Lentisphaerae bacterium]|nr:glycoside hydrolase family 30 protein [Lentisphaerota bacterium]